MSETKMTLEALQALIANAGYSMADVVATTKAYKESKPTVKSLTMDSLVAAKLAGPVLSDNVVQDVCARCEKAGLDKPDTRTVTTIMGYGSEFDAAMTRAGYEWHKVASEPATEQEAAPATSAPTEPAKAPQPRAEVRHRAA